MSLGKMMSEALESILDGGDTENKGKRYFRNDFTGVHERKRMDFVTREGAKCFAELIDESDDDGEPVFKWGINNSLEDYWFIREGDVEDLIEYFTDMKNNLAVIKATKAAADAKFNS